MIKKLKPQGRRGRFSFLNKETIFRNLLKDTLSQFNDRYRIAHDDSSYSDISGDLHFLLHERPERRYSVRTIDLFYRASTHEVKLTFYKSVLPRGLGKQNEKGIIKTFKKGELNSASVKSIIINWFEKDTVPGFKVHVIFTTEFPLFNYERTFDTDSIGSSFAWEVANDIFNNEILKNDQKEVRSFYEFFKTSGHMTDSTLRSSVIPLSNEVSILVTSEMLGSEIGNQLYARLAPVKEPETIKSRKVYYFKTLFELFTNWWKRNTLQGRVQ